GETAHRGYYSNSAATENRYMSRLVTAILSDLDATRRSGRSTTCAPVQLVTKCQAGALTLSLSPRERGRVSTLGAGLRGRSRRGRGRRQPCGRGLVVGGALVFSRLLGEAGVS